MLIGALKARVSIAIFCPDAVAAYAASLRTGRATKRDGLWPCGAEAPKVPYGLPKTCHKIQLLEYMQSMRIRVRIAALAPLRGDKPSKKGLPKPTNRHKTHASSMSFAFS